MTLEAQKIVEAWTDPRTHLVVVVTGAGISVASGIPAFRGTDPEAVWNRDVTELGTFEFFRRDPVMSWRWYLSRFHKLAGARPNAAHDALVKLERWQIARGRQLLLITQNIDTLHEEAGSKVLIKVHGSADRVRCPEDGCLHGAPRGSIERSNVDFEAFRADPKLEHLPRCPECGAVLRQHVLWFDETYDSHEDYQFRRIWHQAASGDLFLFIGTSFSVGITDILLNMARQHGSPILSVDPGSTEAPDEVEPLRIASEVVLPEVCTALGAT